MKRHQELIYHLEKHLLALKTNVSIAYSKIHQDIMFKEPFSELVDRFYFPDEDELTEFTGQYALTDDPNNTMRLRSKQYYLTPAVGGAKLIKASSDKFVLSSSPETDYIEFARDKQGKVSAVTLFRTDGLGVSSTIEYTKID